MLGLLHSEPTLCRAVVKTGVPENPAGPRTGSRAVFPTFFIYIRAIQVSVVSLVRALNIVTAYGDLSATKTLTKP